MSPADVAARDKARQRHDIFFSSFDVETEFVARALKWLHDERSNGRLGTGAPVTLVRFDFSGGAAKTGASVDLHGGVVDQGVIVLCNNPLTVATIPPSARGLATPLSHQSKLQAMGLAQHTSVTYNPPTQEVLIRLRCLPSSTPIPLKLATQLDQSWLTSGLTLMSAELDRFHWSKIDTTALAELLVDINGVVPGARIAYRNALFLYLSYEIGLTEAAGYRVIPLSNEVQVKHLPSNVSAIAGVIGSRAGAAGFGNARAQRRVAAAQRKPLPAGNSVHISCISCNSQHSSSIECGSPSVSLRHRHVEAA